ncbi:PREDICTED: UDP-glucuronosyltransferase 2A3-like [Dufourea novaeangliae]|uniref:UDP-glucuronosyltransferase 1-9 n=1 Tax=Dufourea novaeangliae TaxID=178035 RepID=A0A154PMD7_DUFNO|nr:PREDICTED: UDP-glucuronosyltransferase 2A3-like [Dufourea novaeangliae]KZC13026.1 UDP-glucuronosyltransferase 1-9 [Dufourea novaeangliae]
MRVYFLTLLALLACCHFGNGLRILGIFPLNGRSHFVMASRLMEELAERGHQVDVVSHFPRKTPMPNYKDLSIAGSLPQVVNNMDAKNVSQFNKMNFENIVQVAGISLCNLLSHKTLQDLINNPPKDPPYDVIVVEVFLSPCYLAFGEHLKVPVVAMMTSSFFDWLEDVTGNPHNPSFMPGLFSPYGQRMTFRERLMNTMLTTYVTMKINSLMQPMSETVKEHFGTDSSINEIYKTMSTVLVNSHHSLNGIRPHTTSVFEVGGLHINDKTTESLSPEVKKWLDESTHGCIYFTFGSMVRIESFPKETLDVFYTVFERIAPVRVLMKVAKKEDLPPGLPKNVMIQSWFSQVAVFKHKNVKAFISHGGLMSLQEATYYGIPIIGIPMFGDQHNNMRNADSLHIAVNLVSMQNVTVETLSYAIDKVLHDETYRTSMKKTSELFKDRPIKPIDLAVYVVEYTARHGNVLQSPVIELNWWQRNLLDVYGFLLACVVSVLAVLVLVLRKLTKLVFGCNSCTRKKKTKASESKKQK